MSCWPEFTVRGVHFCATRPAILVPLFAADPETLCRQAETAQAAPEADVVELRLDALPPAQYAATVEAVRKLVQKPLLATVRTRTEGGEAELQGRAYADACAALLDLPQRPDLLDVEFCLPEPLRADLTAKAKAAGVAVVYSAHRFDLTPPTDEMTDLLCAMADTGADIAKLAVMPHTAADAARLLQATAQAAERCPHTPLLTMSMGALGAVTRFCGGAFGSAATFGTLQVASAPGQPPAAQLRQKCIGAGSEGEAVTEGD